MAKKALVLGGSGGIGKVAAAVLQEAGAELYLSGRNYKEGLPGHFVGWEFGSQGRSLDTSLSELEVKVGGLEGWDYLVFAWGPYEEAALAGASDAHWKLMVEANFLLPGMILSRALVGMAERGFGRILLFGASGSDQIIPKKVSAVYQAAKTALGVLVKSTARQYAGRNIACNLLCPGYAVTEYYSEHERQAALARSPGGIASTPEDFTSIIGELLLQENILINGAIIAAGRGL